MCCDWTDWQCKLMQYASLLYLKIIVDGRRLLYEKFPYDIITQVYKKSHPEKSRIDEKI